jgi:hypothetical protein
MIMGPLIVGVLFGAVAASISLFLGSSLLLALGVYAGVGNIALLLAVTLQFVWSLPSQSRHPSVQHLAQDSHS